MSRMTPRCSHSPFSTRLVLGAWTIRSEVGYRIPFKSNPLLSRRPVSFRLPGNLQHHALLLKEIVILHEKGVIASYLGPKYIILHSCMFLVPKPNGTFRPIVNVSKLNVYIQCPQSKWRRSNRYIQLSVLRIGPVP